MRVVYLDEAGISNPKDEPFVVVAAVVLHGDEQCRPVEDHLQALARDYVPPYRSQDFFFHAQDIWHGAKSFDREIYPLSVRLDLFRALAAIPHQFHVPVAFGVCPRDRIARNLGLDLSSPEVTMSAQIIAAFTCTMAVNSYLAGEPGNDERIGIDVASSERILNQCFK